MSKVTTGYLLSNSIRSSRIDPSDEGLVGGRTRGQRSKRDKPSAARENGEDLSLRETAPLRHPENLHGSASPRQLPKPREACAQSVRSEGSYTFRVSSSPITGRNIAIYRPSATNASPRSSAAAIGRQTKRYKPSMGCSRTLKSGSTAPSHGRPGPKDGNVI